MDDGIEAEREGSLNDMVASTKVLRFANLLLHFIVNLNNLTHELTFFREPITAQRNPVGCRRYIVLVSFRP